MSGDRSLAGWAEIIERSGQQRLDIDISHNGEMPRRHNGITPEFADRLNDYISEHGHDIVITVVARYQTEAES